MSQGQQLGLLLKEQALDGFEGRDWLVRARIAITFWLKENPHQRATSDVVQRLVGPPPSANTAGAVFRTGFVLVGYTPSTRPERHGNRVGMWRLDLDELLEIPCAITPCTEDCEPDEFTIRELLEKIR